MEDKFNLLKVIYEAIEDEMMRYAEELEAELIAKFEEEFEEKIRKRRNQIVLDVCEQIELGYHRDPRSVIPSITIKL
jgi:hypothetical protein